MKTIIIKVQSSFAVFSLLAAAYSSVAGAAIFSDRHAFNLATRARIVDDFENQNYQHVMSDTAMSEVIGETEYFTYGGNVVNHNNIMPGFGVGGLKATALCVMAHSDYTIA
jgi:hypothetical protein